MHLSWKNILVAVVIAVVTDIAIRNIEPKLTNLFPNIVPPGGM